MYEFIVLALLMAGPMHGYGIRQIMNRMIGPYRAVAWGPLYSALRKLQEAGLIEAVPEEGVHPGVDDGRGGPPSKRYRLTEAGRARFHELMAVPREPEPEYAFTFGVKLARLGHVAPAQRLALLRDYQQYCQAHIAHLEAAAQHIGRAHIPPLDRPWILATMDRWRAIWAADAAWVAEQLRILEASGGEPPPMFFSGDEPDSCAYSGLDREKGVSE
jgi:DNA-binding PadR family transcriptional regulator